MVSSVRRPSAKLTELVIRVFLGLGDRVADHVEILV